MPTSNRLFELLEKNQAKVLADWLKEQLAGLGLRKETIREAELREQCREFLSLFAVALQTSAAEAVSGPEWSRVRELLANVSRSRGLQGFSPSETARFVMSLKKPMLSMLRSELGGDAEALFAAVWQATILLDDLALYTTEVFQKGREELIARQQAEMMELSTPVVKLWDGILALPMIGTLDSARTQVVMENLLQKIVETGSEIAIIDITGVPAVDTLVAQHLMKTIEAARLMGADCIISGIRPQIAQTIVHLGVELRNVVTKANLADALALALRQRGLSVTRHQQKP